MAVNNVSLRQ